ncbi:MAG: discoidin domain-containing protein, partial [Pseudomonadota bacterium]
GRIETVFPPHRCRFIKINLLANGNDNPWSINELSVFSPENHIGNIRTALPNEEEIDHLLAFLKTQKVDFVYTGHWLSAVIRVKSQGKIGAVISNLFLGDNGESDPEPDRFIGAALTPKVGLVVEKKENQSLEKILQEAGHLYRKKEIGPFMVYYDFMSSKGQPSLSLKDVKVSSNANTSDAKKAIDGNLKTRWTSGRPQEPGLYFQIDLGNIQSIKGCSLLVSQSVNDYPRSLRFLSSPDGRSWQEIKTTTQKELYWTGETLLKISGEKTSYSFPPVSLRYLRLLQEGQDPVYYWSIHELKLF